MKKSAATFLLLFTLVCGCTQKAGFVSGEVPPPHHTEEGFRNPHLQPGKRGFLRYLKMRYFSGEQYADYDADAHRVETQPPDLQQVKHPGREPQVTWLGHATVLVQYQGMNILTDPMFSDRASPVHFAGPRRVTPPALKIDQLPPIDLVVISHNHYDHLDAGSVRQLGSNPRWLVPIGLRQWLMNNTIPGDRIVEFDWWDTHRFDNISVTATPAQHWSARSLWDRNETLWASWLVEVEDFSFWYSGDTGYNPIQFREIGERFREIDLGLISIGAYAPRWFMKDVHINPEEALQIHLDIRARRSLGIQWGTFPMTAEPIDEPPRRLHEALRAKGLSPDAFATMKIGETRVVDR